MLAILLWLGFWQLDRAEQKRMLGAGFSEALPATPQQVETAALLRAMPRFTAVELTGRYDGARQALLDAQVHDGRAGYRVWTPLLMPSGDRVLVDRGWVLGSPDRRELPDVAVTGVERTVRGFIAPLPEPGVRVGQRVQEAGGWPRRLAWPDEAALAAVWDEPLPPLLVLLAPGEPDGFVRDWNPVHIPPERHIGYAVQWFALAFTLVVIVVVLTWRNRRHD